MVQGNLVLKDFGFLRFISTLVFNPCVSLQRRPAGLELPVWCVLTGHSETLFWLSWFVFTFVLLFY